MSAVPDNATLAAAEIGPQLSIIQIKSALMGLLIAGGMLIPGNIPNIVAAGMMEITGKEWVRYSVPFGFALLLISFAILFAPGGLGMHETFFSASRGSPSGTCGMCPARVKIRQRAECSRKMLRILV